jgi:hypothetical protein
VFVIDRAPTSSAPMVLARRIEQALDVPPHGDAGSRRGGLQAILHSRRPNLLVPRSQIEQTPEGASTLILVFEAPSIRWVLRLQARRMSSGNVVRRAVS